MGEHRHRPVRALLEYWRLTGDQQVALASHQLPDGVAAELLKRSWLTPVAREMVAGQAPAGLRLQWASHAHELDDDRIWDHLIAATRADPHVGHPGGWAAGQILNDRPGLRRPALESGLHNLVIAASMVDLDPDDQDLLLAHLWALSRDVPRGALPWPSALFKLLDRTSTTISVRAAALDLAERSPDVADGIVEHFLPGRHTPYPVGVALADINDPAAIELLCLRANHLAYYGECRSFQWHKWPPTATWTPTGPGGSWPSRAVVHT